MLLRDYILNCNIKAKEVRLIGFYEKPIVLHTKTALLLAMDHNLDLIQIPSKEEIPIVYIADYEKFIYDKKKNIKKPKIVQDKTVRFTPQTDDHDYAHKFKQIEDFLRKGSRVKAYVFFKGRSIIFKDQGEILLLKLIQDLEEIAKVGMMPKLEGKKMSILLIPKTKK